MKKLGIVLLLLASTSAFAFGGGGGRNNRTHEWYKHGVDAIGVHIGGDTCADDQELIDGKCLTKCAEGLERNTDNSCTVCTNGNIYISCTTNHCEAVVRSCVTDDDCFDNSWWSDQSNCCDQTTHTCKIHEPVSHLCPETDGKQCISNKDCTENEYCYLGIENDDDDLPDGGTCVPLDDGVAYTYNSKTFLRSENTMNMWAAQNWCRAHGMNIVSLAGLGIDKDNLGSFEQQHGYCGQTYCENIDWTSLQQVFSFGQWGEIWIDNTSYVTPRSWGACAPSNMSIKSSRICTWDDGCGDWFDDNFYALCE